MSETKIDNTIESLKKQNQWLLRRNVALNDENRLIEHQLRLSIKGRKEDLAKIQNRFNQFIECLKDVTSNYTDEEKKRFAEKYSYLTNTVV